MFLFHKVNENNKKVSFLGINTYIVLSVVKENHNILYPQVCAVTRQQFLFWNCGNEQCFSKDCTCVASGRHLLNCLPTWEAIWRMYSNLLFLIIKPAVRPFLSLFYHRNFILFMRSRRRIPALHLSATKNDSRLKKKNAYSTSDWVQDWTCYRGSFWLNPLSSWEQYSNS